jgi:hypothetical protein
MPRYYTDDDDDGDRVLKDGEVLRTSMFMLDAAQRDVRDHIVRDHFVRDAVSRHNGTAGHRPGFVIDTLVHTAQPVSLTDADTDLQSRRGTTVRAVFADRERALDEVERRRRR